MQAEPVVVEQGEREWEGWAPEQGRGEIAWKTLISADLTPSDSLTLGIGRLRAGESLREHRHPQAEVYLVLEGTLTLAVSGRRRAVAAGAAAFVAGGTLHACANEGDGEVRFAYAFAADRAGDVAYEFPGA